MDFFWIIFVLGVAAVVVIGIMGILSARRRRQELSAWALAKGFLFSPGKVHGTDARYGDFTCLRKGSNRYAYNIIEGEWSGRKLLCFDYHYETHSSSGKHGRQTHHHHFSALVIESNVPLKPLLLRPEGFFDRVKEFFGFDDIDFESAEFSRKFYVAAEDRKWAYDVLHARAMQFLLEMPRFLIQFSRHQVIAYRTSRFKVPDFEAAALTVCGLLGQLPEYLVRQQTEDIS